LRTQSSETAILESEQWHFRFLLDPESVADRLIGATENMVTIRFWILSIIFALIGVATLKIR